MRRNHLACEKWTDEELLLRILVVAYLVDADVIGMQTATTIWGHWRDEAYRRGLLDIDVDDPFELDDD